MKSKVILLILILSAFMVGCAKVNDTPSLSEDPLIINSKEINVNMSHDQIKSILGQPGKTDVGYFFNDNVATDYYDGDNALIRFAVNNKLYNTPTDEVLSILICGGQGGTKSGIKAGDSMEKLFSVLGKKDPSGHRSSTFYYIDYEFSNYKIRFYYDPADNIIIRFTMYNGHGMYD